MKWNQTEIEKILKKHLIINSNTDTFYNCYYKCADKRKIAELFNQRNHEIIFGRRGTGKTTLFKALYYCTNFGIFEDNGCKCLYIDMEDVVPDKNELVTTDDSVVIIETYRKLLYNLVDQLIAFWVDLRATSNYYGISYTDEDIKDIGEKLDLLLNLVVYGRKSNENSIETETTNESIKSTKGLTANIEFNPDSSITALLSKFSFGKSGEKSKIKQVSIEKKYIYTLDIYSIKSAFDNVIRSFKLNRLIICIDEFTRVDKGLGTTIQPYIAQLIKDTFFRNPNISVKVSSLWNKTEMQRRQLGKDRTGIELGEDIKRGVDLDTMFFDSEYSTMFFENMIMATCQLYSQDPVRGDSNFCAFLINTLFSDREAFKLLICGSQGVPRIFGNLLIAAIDKRVEKGRTQIDPQIVFECVIENYTRDVRRKLPYTEKIVSIFDDFISDSKTRFVFISIEDYKKNRAEIEGLLDNNYMHQYPSERVNRRLRNRYKIYLIHFGNYLESLGIKEWRKNLASSTALYPDIPEDAIVNPELYQLHL